MDGVVIRAFRRKVNTVLVYFQVFEDGSARFIVSRPRRRQVEYVALKAFASAEIWAEINAKSQADKRYKKALITTDLTAETKHFIALCWSELQLLKPQICLINSNF